MMQFLGGLLIGAFVGFLALALCVAAKDKKDE